MESVRKYIYKQVVEQKLSQQEAKQMLLELQEKQEHLNDDIAIIGIAGRFAGADNVNEYWENLRKGVCSIGEFPKERRKDIDPLLKNRQFSEFLLGAVLPKDSNPEELDIYYRGGYLNEIDKFDAGFFNIPPREAKFISPLQRLLLKTSWEAIEDSGYGGEKILNTNTGVFVGHDNTSLSYYKYITIPDPLHETGSYSSILASRISYLFNLKGPAVVVDTACSSAVVALHLAAQSLKNKECEMAIVGGIYLLYANNKSQNDLASNLNKATSDDECIRTFDKKAKGTVWSEGVGTILIKPLKKAILDKDNIYAVIKGSAINNDGFSNGITAPNAEAQEEVITRAWKEAKIEPETLSYIESHGTGTIIGDPIEIKGLTNAFRKFTKKRQFCGIGSVKPNIGHSVSTSGMASILKIVLSLQHNEIPASINFDDVNPFINFTDSPLYVNDKSTKWEKGSIPRRAGISAFGFSGTNCHIVLEEAPKFQKDNLGVNPKQNIFAISARDENVLMELLQKYDNYFRNETKEALSDICYTANTGRGHYLIRLAIIAASHEELAGKIANLLHNGLHQNEEEGVFFGQHKIIVSEKKNREDYEITEKERMQFTKVSSEKVNDWVSSGYTDSDLLNEICALYTKGSKLDWEEMYKSQKRKKVSIPVYPFAQTRYWAELVVNSMNNDQNEINSIEEVISPLLDKCLCDSLYQTIFKTDFNIDKQWILSEHKILGNSTIPGTAHLEMVREACKKYYNNDHIDIRNVIFLMPLVINESESKEVHLILRKESGYMEFTIASSTDSDSENSSQDWLVHTEGRVYRISEDYDSKISLDDLKRKCPLSIDMSSRTKMQNFTFGPRWSNISNIHAGEQNEALLTMELPEAYLKDVDRHSLHPALLDNAVNGMAQFIKDSGIGGMFLPLSYKSIRIYENLPSRFYSYVRRIGRDVANTETKTYNITLIDLSGKVIADINEYTIKRVNKAEQILKAGYGYEVGWVKEDQSELKDQKDENGSILVFKDNLGFADRIIEKLSSSNKKIIEVEIGREFTKRTNGYTISSSQNDFDILLKEVKNQHLVRIINLSSLSEESFPEDINKLHENLNSGVYSLFFLIKALVNNKFNENIDITLICDDVNKVTGDEKNLNPHHSSMFGLAKVVSQEYDHLRCRCIDIDKNTPVECIIREIYSDKSALKIALRDGNRYVEEFREIDTKNVETIETEIKDNGAYIITGGLGGIGLEIAKYFASKNKVNLVLLNRSKFPQRDKWDDYNSDGKDSIIAAKIKAIRAIEENGSSVDCISCDISNYDEMSTILDTIKAKFGNINGLVHSAGVAGEGFMFSKSEDTLKEVLAPKILGTWVLDTLTQNENMDFFILFSSIAAILGGVGQSDYVAANSYMDTYAAYRSKKGRRTITINWPAWTEVGMAAEHDFGQEGKGVFKPISTSTAMFAFDRVLSSSVTNIIPVELNYEVVATLIDKFPIRLSNKMRTILQKNKAKSEKSLQKNTQVLSDFMVSIKGLDSEDTFGIKEKIAQIWGRILEIKEIDIYETFYSLGGDSMLAAQLIKELDKEYPGIVNIADIFTYPSIAQLSEYIENCMVSKTEDEKDATTEENDSDKELKEMLDRLEAGESSIDDALNVLKRN